MDVFSFGITMGPKSVKRLAEHFGFDYMDCDYFIFHQANLLMNEKIRTKLKLPPEKVPYCLQDFGNTASASIPLTIVTQLKGKVENKKTDWIACGFGVGLSWGAVHFVTDGIIISKLVEV
jgi:3-oxoacyl-[acyl-carrier-protein] synthase-3